MVERRWLWFIALMMLPALACNAFAGAGREPTLAPPPTAVSESGFATQTPSNTSAPEIAPTATLPGHGGTASETPTGASTVTVLVDLNVRNGPGVQYGRVGFLLEGSNATIVGIDPASGWWKIQCPANINSSECWLSGGSQYSQASNAANVPVAIAPPTPTPVPVVLDDNMGLLAYVDNGRLTTTQLDLTQNPPLPLETTQLDSSPDVQQVAISPNGTAVAYIVQVVDGNELRVANIDGRNSRALVRSAELPFVGAATELPDFAREGDTNLSVQILQMQWVDDDTLAFNSGIINSAGFSPGSHSDLWTVTTAGEATTRFAAGKGGPIFTISANKQVLFSRQDAILRASLEDTQLETVLTFDPVGISEAFYYPRPQWSADGSRAYVAISDQLFADGAQVANPTATLWTIPSSGVAERGETLAANVIFDTPVFSDDGEQIAFVSRAGGGSEADLVIGGGVEQNNLSSTTEGVLRPLAWHLDGERLLFTTDGFYGIGQGGETAVRVPLADGQGVAAGDWVTGDWFITAVSDGSSLVYQLGNVEGNVNTVAQAGGFVPLYDIWVP